MKNTEDKTPLTSAENFLLMRLITTLEGDNTLPDGVDWQTIYSKLSSACLIARRS